MTPARSPVFFVAVAATLLASATLLIAADAKPVSLFDGKTLTGWVSGNGKPPTAGWVVEDGTLHRAAKGGDLFSEKEYGDFEFAFEWKIDKAANSGVKYRVKQFTPGGTLGVEYQLIDDAAHPDGKKGTHQTACIYDIKETVENKPVKAVGDWNASKIVVKQGKFEHWLNGTKVSEIDTASDEWKERIAKSKFKNVQGFGLNAKGKIMLQDHGDKVWFRNLSITELN